jgi:hypothetical protein
LTKIAENCDNNIVTLESTVVISFGRIFVSTWSGETVHRIFLLKVLALRVHRYFEAL